jgi:hypothetical protein
MACNVHPHISRLNSDMTPLLQTQRSSLDEFVAHLTEAAYPIALRHTSGERWLDLELDLWRVIAQAVLKWEPCGTPPRS